MSQGAYGGDEVGAVVVDMGTNSVRAGFAGEEQPKHDVPTMVGVRTDFEEVEDTKKSKYITGSNRLSFAQAKVEIESPLNKHGIIQNWEAYENLMEHTFNSCLQTDISRHPVLFSEPAWNERPKREKQCELMFETFNVPAFFICKTPVLSCYSTGRSTAMVLDSGHMCTSAVAVHEGYVLQKSIARSPLAGNFVMDQCREMIEKSGVEINPHYMVKKKGEGKNPWEKKSDLAEVCKSWHNYQVKNVLRDFVQQVPYVNDKELNDQELSMGLHKRPYYFPCGAAAEYGAERMQVVEQLFNTSLVRGAGANSMNGTSHLVKSSVNLCDVDLRPSLYSSVLVTGGNSLLQGFLERLQYELQRNVPPSIRLKLHAHQLSMERKCSAWIGGSILASLGTFQQLWASKMEYEEHGSSIVDKKCP